MSRKFFKSFFSCLLALMMVVSLTAIPSSAAPSLSKTSFTLTKGYVTTLSVSGTSGTVKWSTGDKSVATVNSKGKVSGKKLGSTYIYAKVDGVTLKSKVTVVAGKITVGKSSVDLEEGQKTTVKIKAIGTHALSVGSTDRSVARATWSGAKFDGNIIKLTITAVGSGTAKIKVYATKYPSSIYKYINVTVGDGYDDLISDLDLSGGTTDSNASISLSTQSASVKIGETYPAYAFGTSSISAVSSNQNIASVSVQNSSASGGYSNINIKGVSAGTAKVRVYLTNNSKKYADIDVTVVSNAQYYTVLDSQPVRISGSDYSITLNLNGTRKYMLVPNEPSMPKGYDESKVNDVVAAYEKTHRYYTIYTNMPNKKLNTDIIYPVTATIANQPSYRYMLVPKDFDQPTVDTIILQYAGGKYEYNTVYTAYPTKQYSTDVVKEWSINVYDPTTNKSTASSRYLLLPYNYDSAQAEQIMAKDKTKYQSQQEYAVLTTPPTQYDYKNYELLIWNNPKTNSARYMLVPKTNCDYVKRNDAIYADTGVYCYYNAYSTDPTSSITNYNNESIFPSTQLETGKRVYIIVDMRDSDADRADKITKALQGTTYNFTPRY